MWSRRNSSSGLVGITRTAYTRPRWRDLGGRVELNLLGEILLHIFLGVKKQDGVILNWSSWVIMIYPNTLGCCPGSSGKSTVNRGIQYNRRDYTDPGGHCLLEKELTSPTKKLVSSTPFLVECPYRALETFPTFNNDNLFKCLPVEASKMGGKKPAKKTPKHKYGGIGWGFHPQLESWLECTHRMMITFPIKMTACSYSNSSCACLNLQVVPRLMWHLGKTMKRNQTHGYPPRLNL